MRLRDQFVTALKNVGYRDESHPSIPKLREFLEAEVEYWDSDEDMEDVF